MSVKNYQLYCDFCGYKRLSDGSDVQDLIQVKNAPIPCGTPYLDPAGVLVVPKPKPQQKKFKCPSCGRAIKAKKISSIEPVEKVENETDYTPGRETSTAGQPVPRQSAS
jgi:hypothetical protein